MFQRGDLVEIDGLLAVVVRVDGDEGVPEEHVMLWFGEPPTTRVSKGGPGGAVPIVHTVPLQYCRAAPAPTVRH
jgi:hypothetical protein